MKSLFDLLYNENPFELGSKWRRKVNGTVIEIIAERKALGGIYEYKCLYSEHTEQWLRKDTIESLYEPL